MWPTPPESAFKTPLVPFVPCLGIAFNTWFIVVLPWDSLLRLLIWTVLGMLIYLLYGVRYSVVGKQQRANRLKSLHS